MKRAVFLKAARQLRDDRDDGSRDAVRAIVGNFLQEISRGEIKPLSVTEFVSAVGRELSVRSEIDWSNLRSIMANALKNVKPHACYGIPIRFDRAKPVVRALTLVNNTDGSFAKALAPSSSGSNSSFITSFNTGACSGYVGLKGAPVWMTPLTPQIDERLEESIEDRSVRGELLREMVASLGLKHLIPKGSAVLALVSKLPMMELVGGKHSPLVPASKPSSLEARGHPRFRTWAGDSEKFGRTYELDAQKRSLAEQEHSYGLREAVTRRLTIAGFERCYDLGRMTEERNIGDTDEAYLKAIGVEKGALALLRELVRSATMPAVA